MPDESDEVKIPKSEMDRKLAAWKAQEAEYKKQLLELQGKVETLTPLANQATEAQNKLAELVAERERESVFGEVGVTDPELRRRLLVQHAADVAAAAEGEEAPDLRTWLETAKADPWLSRMFGAPPAAGAAPPAPPTRKATTPPANPPGTASPPPPGRVRDYAAEIAAAGDLDAKRAIQAEWRAALSAGA